MSRKIAVAFVFMLVTSFAYANSPGGCPPFGSPLIGPPPPYDYMANGMPSYDGCFDEQLVAFRDASYGQYPPFCGSYSTYWEFLTGGTAVLTQTLTLDSNAGNPQHLTFMYQLDFEDSHNDGNNQFWAIVTDMTTGTQLVYDYYNGWYGSSCGANIRKRYINPTSDIRGHQIQVRFISSKCYACTDTKVYVKGISLLVGTW